MKNKWMLMLIILTVSSLFFSCSEKRIVKRKQIILISVDTLRGDHVTPYGYFRDTTPRLSQLVEDSVYYPHAYTNGCWTFPSHISLLTGTLPSRHGIIKDWKTIVKNQIYPKLNESVKTISEILKSHRAATIKCAALPKEIGIAKRFDFNFPGDVFKDSKKFHRLLKIMEKNKEKDFFLFIHTWMVHTPYANSYFLEEGAISREKRHYINGFRAAGKGKKMSNLALSFKNFLKENSLFNVNNCIALYDSGIRYVDQCIGKIIDKTKQLGIYDDLLFIVVSDHGEHFAEHYPGAFYSDHGRDFYKIEIPPFIQGKSLLITPSKRKSYQNPIISEASSRQNIERKMIRLGDLKYIVTMKNPSEPGRVNWKAITQRRLFDLKNDPLEKNNLYNDLKYRQLCINMEKMLFKIIKNSTKTNRSLKEARVSQETLKLMETLGYVDSD